MKFAQQDMEAVIAADRKAQIKEAKTWRLGIGDMERLTRRFYPKPFYETHMMDFMRAVENEVIARISKQIMDAPVVGMFDSYHVLRRKAVLDILNERYINDDDDE